MGSSQPCQSIRARRAHPGRHVRGSSWPTPTERGDFDRTYPSLLERGRRSPTFLVILQLAYALRMEPVKLFADAVARMRKKGQS